MKEHGPDPPLEVEVRRGVGLGYWVARRPAVEALSRVSVMGLIQIRGIAAQPTPTRTAILASSLARFPVQPSGILRAPKAMLAPVPCSGRVLPMHRIIQNGSVHYIVSI